MSGGHSDEQLHHPSVTARLRSVFEGFAGEQGLCYRHSEGDLSYDELYRRATGLRNRLAARMPEGTARSPVLIWGHKDPSYMVGYWACLHGGWPIVPIEPETPLARVRQIAAASGACAVLAADAGTSELVQEALAGDLPVIQVGAAEDMAFHGGPQPGADIDPDDVAYIMFSSGTIGQPKGIQVTYANLVDFIEWLPVLLPQAGTWYAVSGIIRYCFDVSLFEIWTAWLHRLPIIVLDHADLAHSTGFIERLAAGGVSFWVSTPSIVRLFLKNRRFNGKTLPLCRTFLFCGEPLTKTIVRDLHARFPGCRVVNTYGPTECTVAVTSVEITEAHLADTHELPIGYARAGTTLEHPAPSQSEGEIFIRGRSVGRGYINLPDKQAIAFPARRLYRTADWGWQAQDGLWYFKGRIDREVKIQGLRIDLGAVESHLRSLDGVEDAVVDVFMLGDQPRALNAFVLGPSCVQELRALADRLAAELPPYLLPRFWYADFDVQLNNNSKLDRKRVVLAAADARLRHVHAVPVGV